MSYTERAEALKEQLRELALKSAPVITGSVIEALKHPLTEWPPVFITKKCGCVIKDTGNMFDDAQLCESHEKEQAERIKSLDEATGGAQSW